MINWTKQLVSLSAVAVLACSSAIAVELDVRVTSGGSDTVTAAPCGATLPYEVRGTLSDVNNLGLAGFVFDAEFSGGPLTPADTPVTDPMLNFAEPAGITGPGGFGGSVVGGRLVVVGGAQNTSNNPAGNTPVPSGTVITGVAHVEQVLVTGLVTVPAEPGVYTLALGSLAATVITDDDVATGFWVVDAADIGTVGSLTIHVLPANPPATASNDGPVCQGQDGTLLGGPDGMASYSWTGTGGFTSTSQNPVLSPAVSGIYTLTVTDLNGCIGVATTVMVLSPDTCDNIVDCNNTNIDDACDIANGTSEDCNGNGIPDECDAGGTSSDCNTNGVPDECEPDCNASGVPDECESDSDGDGVIDDCDNCPSAADPSQADGDSNGIGDACQPCHPQLLSDGGFEAGGDGWQRVNNGGRSVIDSKAHRGDRALQMLGSQQYPRTVLQTVAVHGGATYQASIWVRTASLGSGGVTTSLSWLNQQEIEIQTDDTAQLAGTNDWTWTSARVAAPAGAAYVRFRLFMPVDPTGAGAAWFDDAEFVELSAACDDGDPCTVDRCEPFVGCVSIFDGTDSDGDNVPDCLDRCAGFGDSEDVDGDGVPDGCDACVGQELVDSGFEAEGEGWTSVNNGGRSVVGTPSHSGVKSLQMLVHTRYGREVYQHVAVAAGRTYEAGAWVRTHGVGGAGVSVSLIWLDAVVTGWNTAGHVLRTDMVGGIMGTNDWTPLSGQFTAPPGAVEVRFHLFTSTDPDADGAAWFDDAGLCDIGNP